MPKKIAVIVDSSCGLSKEEMKSLKVVQQPLLIVQGSSKTYRDGVDIDTEKLYELIEEKESLSTSQVPPGETIKLVEELLTEHDGVVCLPISSGLSSSYNTWKAMEEEFAGKLHVLDGKTIANACAEVALGAKELAEEGVDKEAIDRYVADACANTYGLLVCNDFQRLVKGGRMGAFKGAVASFLKLNVLIEFKDGKLAFKDKSRSAEKLAGTMLETFKKQLSITDKNELAKVTFLHAFSKKNKKGMEEALGLVKKNL